MAKKFEQATDNPLTALMTHQTHQRQRWLLVVISGEVDDAAAALCDPLRWCARFVWRPHRAASPSRRASPCLASRSSRLRAWSARETFASDLWSCPCCRPRDQTCDLGWPNAPSLSRPRLRCRVQTRKVRSWFYQQQQQN